MSGQANTHANKGHANKAHAHKGFGALGHAMVVASAETLARVRRLPVGPALVLLLALAWIAASGWWAFILPRYDDTAAQRYQAEVAKCRELATSEARYDCVSRALISRDRENFGKAMLVFIPPLVAVLGRYVWRETRAAMHERERARLAEIRSRQQLAQFHREMMAKREALKPAKRADWDVDTSWAEEIAQSPRGVRRPPDAQPPAHATSAPHAVKRA
jgi:hypothetical protein